MRPLLGLSLTCAVLAGCAAKAGQLDGARLSIELGPYIQGAGHAFQPPDRIPEAQEIRARKQEYGRWKQRYKALRRDQQIHYCIYQLRNQTNAYFSIPMTVGGWRLYSPWRYGSDPQACPTEELIRIGKPAIPALIAALNDTAETQIHPSSPWDQVWRVQDAAAYVIQHVACKRLVNYSYLNTLSKDEQAQARARILDWWEKSKHLDEVAWAKAALLESSGEDAWYYREQAVYTLYARLGKSCFPVLARAYGGLPAGRDGEWEWGPTSWLKSSILRAINACPTASQRPLLLRALGDAPLEIRIEAARGLWELGDDTGLRQMIKETEQHHIPSWDTYGQLCFLLACDTAESREAVYKCLRARDARLRADAVLLVPRMRMEKAVRALPELFDDLFVLSRYAGEPQLRDFAAEAFTELVPESPRFTGKTDEEQAASIRAIGQWYQANKSRLVWDGRVLRLQQSKP